LLSKFTCRYCSADVITTTSKMPFYKVSLDAKFFFVSQTLKANINSNKYFWGWSNKNFRHAGFYSGTGENGKHWFFQA